MEKEMIRGTPKVNKLKTTSPKKKIAQRARYRKKDGENIFEFTSPICMSFLPNVGLPLLKMMAGKRYMIKTDKVKVIGI